MPVLWAIIAGGLTLVTMGTPLIQPILVTNILLGLIVGVLFEKRDAK